MGNFFKIVFKEKSWFLRDLIELIRPGKLAEKTSERLQQDVVPSISVLDRLIGKLDGSKYNRNSVGRNSLRL